MKKVFLVFIAFVNATCYYSERDDSSMEDDGITSRIIEYEIVEENKSDKNYPKLELHFTANFENDTVSLYLLDSVLFEGSIFTDHTIGIAKKITFARSDVHPVLSINGYKLDDLGNLDGFNYLYVSLIDRKKCKILKTGKEKLFK